PPPPPKKTAEAVVPELYFTDLVALREPTTFDGVSHQPLLSAGEHAGDLGLIDGIPFILDDDGSYDHHLNRFFRECPTMGARSPNTIKAYALDILTFSRFLHEQRHGKGIWKADRQDLIAFHRARRLTDHSARISASSWNRSVTAFEKFYGWARDEGLLTTTPFGKRDWIKISRTPRGPAQGQRYSYREAGARHHDMRYVGLDRFYSFRDIGLRGRQSDGRDNPDWRGRHGERDALFAELLVCTGLRLEEATSLLPADLPRHDDPALGADRSCPLKLPAAICKGGKGREIRVPRRLLRRIDQYVGIERSQIVARWREHRRWDNIRQPIMVQGWSRDFALVSDRNGQSRRRRDGLLPSERRRLLMVDAAGLPLEPAALWLTDDGRPMRPSTWEAVFARAEARCRQNGLDIHITPHMLRHVFAVHMLSLLIRAQLGWIGPDPDQKSAAYRRVIGDPLQKLQRLLGHASIASTYIYLDSLDEARMLVDKAAGDFADTLDDLEIGAPA
ncbi:MAG TPA: tyrosine-type recombinase/integrase, partial [Bosea sp. (in: a-proteobacteria)]|uniref:tyrosine-type recombinase/integrase n=1 Tax=Bosea sp. (in: a-proteobacteria) TaxID=1871050 RepID=UPI002E12F754|nr:tyrosine-type recombinase/integrase [Bosea sp. (in: a-proteobacteria)]